MTRSSDDLLHRPEREANVRIVRITAFAASLSLAVYAAIGASTGLAREGAPTVVLWATAVLALLMSSTWLVTDALLGDRLVYAFVLAADAGIFVALMTLADAELGLLGCGMFVIVGSFAGYHAGKTVFVCHLVLVTALVAVAASRLPITGRLVLEVSTLLWLLLGLPIVARALWSSERQRADQAFRDPLTRVANRAGLERAFPRLREDAVERSQVMCVVAVDLDRFKAVNDTYGHAAGDAVLVDAARHLQAHFGPRALIARTGGEEFTLILVGHRAAVVAAVDSLSLTVGADPRARVTMSVGAVWAAPHGAGDADLASATEAADAAMYEAKRAGGDQLCSRL
ncbi:GGDEF domain-containing protein [Williamsia deligens]|uniref:Diguanylate cyclase n=1 Tax=Williamsia deligens TaxID=321325 RepID=A0ABW3G4W6_9NOCA|nr:GGDEF domain-containing protein [Williamsia deligens]